MTKEERNAYMREWNAKNKERIAAARYSFTWKGSVWIAC